MASAAPSSLEHDLFEAVAGEVDFEPRAGALYGRDASHYRQPPLGVVHPRDAADVEAALAVCRKHGVPIVPRGAGTSLAGQGINSGVVFDFTRHMNRILSVDRDAKTARVQPGVVLDDLRDAAEKYGLTFGPDPSTHAWCTLGGMIGNNACGVHSVMAGKTVDNVERLEVLNVRGAPLRSWRNHGGGTRTHRRHQRSSEAVSTVPCASWGSTMHNRFANASPPFRAV